MDIRIEKNSLLAVLVNHGIMYPTPLNLNYFWSFGSAVGILLVFRIFSGYFDYLYGQVFSLVILIVAAAEASIGLAITIGYYTNRSSISTTALLVGKT